VPRRRPGRSHRFEQGEPEWLVEHRREDEDPALPQDCGEVGAGQEAGELDPAGQGIRGDPQVAFVGAGRLARSIPSGADHPQGPVRRRHRSQRREHSVGALLGAHLAGPDDDRVQDQPVRAGSEPDRVDPVMDGDERGVVTANPIPDSVGHRVADLDPPVDSIQDLAQLARPQRATHPDVGVERVGAIRSYAVQVLDPAIGERPVMQDDMPDAVEIGPVQAGPIELVGNRAEPEDASEGVVEQRPRSRGDPVVWRGGGDDPIRRQVGTAPRFDEDPMVESVRAGRLDELPDDGEDRRPRADRGSRQVRHRHL